MDNLLRVARTCKGEHATNASCDYDAQREPY